MNTLYKFSTILLIILFYTQLNAQVSVEKSDKIIFILGKKYYLHKVESGQTLYSICKVYNTSESDIFLENSEVAKHGLKAGAEIKIPVKDPNIIIEESTITPDNEEFIFHTVERKQTVYFITRKYNISEAELIDLNPEITNGLQPGQKIKVPKPGQVKISPKGEYRYHAVQPGETLFSLAQRYGTSISDIKVENPELNQGLRIGLILRIPTYARSFEEILKVTHDNSEYEYGNYDPLYFEEQGVAPCNSFNYEPGNKFNIAILLPLHMEENHNLRFSEEFFKNSAKFYEFYQGLLLAAKLMKQHGVSLDFHIYDTKASTQEVKSILSNSQLKGMDLIIGPVYSENFKIASGFAKQNKINIVAPFRLRNKKIAVTNPHVFLTTPSNETEVENVSNFIAHSYDKSVLVIHNGTIDELNAIELFKKKLVKSFSSYENIHEIVFKQVNYKAGGNAAVENALSVGLHNIVIIPSKNQVFITQLVSKLNYLTDKYKVTVFGLSAWEQFRNIEIDYLRNLKFHYGTTNYIDKNNKSVQTFDLKYRENFKSEPTDYSYLGYDVCYYFANIMKDYGKHFQFCLPFAKNKKYSKGLRYDFNFERISPFSGFENNWLKIVKIDKELNLINVN